MKTQIILFLITGLALAGCGKGGGGSTPSKELFSLWRSNDNNSPLDMTGGTFGSALSYYEATIAGEICDCDLTIIGDQASGSYVLGSCTYRTGTGGGSDPGCSSGNGTGTYTNSSASLSICRSGGSCESYH